MFCSKCGAQVLVGSNFCQECGSAIATAGPLVDGGPTSDSQSLPASKAKSSIGISDALADNQLARALLGLLACFFGLVIFPAFWGIPFDTKQYGGTLMIVSGSVIAYLWKKRNKSPWIGAVVGVAAAYFSITVSAFVLEIVARVAK